MTAAVIIPFGGYDEWRTASLVWTCQRYDLAGLDFFIGRRDEEPWCKAAAVKSGLTQIRDDVGVLVIADGDVWSDGVTASVDAVTRGAASWAIPHKKVRRLDEASTSRVLEGEEPSREMPLARGTYTGAPGGGVVVLRRELYEEIPLDPRFLGWGSEDYSWGYALTRLAGPPARGVEPLWHLWHPAQPRWGPNGSKASGALRRRYKDARGSEESMRKILMEIIDT